MNVAVVGGGTRCLYLMDFLEVHIFTTVDPVIIKAVADINEDAPGFVKAKEKDLFITTDYNEIFSLDNIDLIIELTGDINIYNDIIEKEKNVRVMAHTSAILFWEIFNLSDLQKKTNHKLERVQTIYDVMVNELINEDIVMIDANYRILDINNTFLERIGLKREEAIGHYCYEITHHQCDPCSGDHHPCPLIEVLKTGRPSRATHIHLDKENNEQHFSISCYPFMDDGKVAGAIEVSKDITKDIQIQKSMMQQEKMVSIGRLSAGVAHEINNPLTTILTSAMLLQEDLEPDTHLAEELKTISNETLRCRKIVKSLLDFSRQTRPAKKLCDLNHTVRESFILTRKQAAFNDITIIEDLAEKLPMVNIDGDQIQQAIINLALNAIEATPRGGTVKLVSRHLPKTNKVEVEVTDTGTGISSEDLAKIFDPFFTTREKGTGLGLAITHGIIEQHGGTIDVESKKGHGTSFFIRLPLSAGDKHDQ